MTSFAPAAAYVPVARLNFPALSHLSLREGYGGIAGHYLMVGAPAIQRHHAARQKVGTGYPRSINQLFRELNRGVDWIFSNHAGYVLQCLRWRQSFHR
jgi:glycerophosphoryl diester phosphodiesterase